MDQKTGLLRSLLPTAVLTCKRNSFFPLFSSYIYNLLTDEASIRYAAQAVLADFHADGVVYLELRTTPRATPSLSADAYVALLVDAICAFEADNPALHTRLILTIDRRHDLPTAEAIVDTALRHRPRSAATPGVVGIDLAGLPSAKPGGAVRELAPAFRRARQADGLGLTVHFAEDEASGTRAELDELLSWEPDRLGHVIWEDDEVKAEIARRGLCLELNLSCNVKAGMVKGGFEGHHFGAWRHVKGPTIALGVSEQKPKWRTHRGWDERVLIIC